MDARVRQKERDLPDQAGQVGSRLPDPEHGSDRARADAGGELLRRALAPVLTQRMGDLVPHHGCDLVVRRVELLEDAGVQRDLATGHAPRVDLRRGEDIHLPFPTRCVLPEHTGLRDDAPGDRADALDLLRIPVDVALRALLLEYLLVGERRALVHLRRGDEEELAALDADGALFARRRAGTRRATTSATPARASTAANTQLALKEPVRSRIQPVAVGPTMAPTKLMLLLRPNAVPSSASRTMRPRSA